MGLAASQARLLTITSRLHDIELKQQNISNQKMRLSNESDEVSTAYSKALNTQRFTLNNGTSNVKMTIKNLYTTGSKYQLKTTDGKTVLPQNIYDAFNATCKTGQDSMSWRNKKYAEGHKESWEQDFVNEFIASVISGDTSTHGLARRYGLDWPKWCEQNPTYPQDSDSFFDFIINNGTNVDFTKSDIEYWKSLCQELQDESGRGSVVTNGKTIETYNSSNTICLSSELLNDPNWLYNAIESGEFVLVDTSGKEVSTSSAKDIDTEYDKEVAARAEAEYNAATAKINRKEKILDNEARKLDTEYSAMNTEYESIKNIIKNNSDKTFNLFS